MCGFHISQPSTQLCLSFNLVVDHWPFCQFAFNRDLFFRSPFVTRWRIVDLTSPVFFSYQNGVGAKEVKSSGRGKKIYKAKDQTQRRHTEDDDDGLPQAKLIFWHFENKPTSRGTGEKKRKKSRRARVCLSLELNLMSSFRVKKKGNFGRLFLFFALLVLVVFPVPAGVGSDLFFSSPRTVKVYIVFDIYAPRTFDFSVVFFHLAFFFVCVLLFRFRFLA